MSEISFPMCWNSEVRTVKHIPSNKLLNYFQHKVIFRWGLNNLVSAHCTYIFSTRRPDFLPLDTSSTAYLPSETVASREMTQSWTKQGRRIPQWFTNEMIELNAGPGGESSQVWKTWFVYIRLLRHSTV